MVWFIIGFLLVFIEIMTTNFGTICFALGAFVAGALSFIPLSLVWQIIAFSIISILAFILLRPIIKRYIEKSTKTVRTNADALTGRTCIVSETIDAANNTGRVAVDGDDWKAVSNDGSVIQKGEKVTIIKIDSIILTVKQ